MAVNYRDQQLRFGNVREVNGTSLVVQIGDGPLSRTIGKTEYAVELGAFVLIGTAQTELVCTVSGIRQDELVVKDAPPLVRTLAACTVVGFLRNGTTFERGVERYPTVGADAYLLTSDAIEAMFGEFDGVPIGMRGQRGVGQQKVRVDKLFGRHTAILGTSGSGKSWTVASLLQTTLREFPRARLLFLDLHNEYPAAFPETQIGSRVRHIPAQDFRLPYWVLNGDEMATLCQASEGNAHNQATLIRETIVGLKAAEETVPVERLSVDTPIRYSFDEFVSKLTALDQEMVPGSRGEKTGPNNGKLTNLLGRLSSRRSDPRYGFLFDGAGEATFESILDQIVGTTSDINLNIVDLSGLPSEVLSLIVGVICRLAFDYKYWDTDPNLVPLTIILEEAHNYLPRQGDARHQICLDRVERIAKEGRKYGVGLFIVSQRPSELSETVLSQCGNFIALRLTNPTDQGYVQRLLPDFLAVAVDMLPYLRTGEAIVAGEAIDIPTRVQITAPNPVPNSQDVSYAAAWTAGLPAGYSATRVVKRWRTRNRDED